MKRYLVYLSLIILCIFAINNLYAKSESANIKFESINIEESDLKAIKELIIDELRKNKVYIITTEASIKYFVRILKMGKKFIITIAKKDNDKVISSGKVSATSIEELDTRIARLISVVLEKKIIKNVVRKDSESKKELEDSESRNEIHFGLGVPLIYFNKNNYDDSPFYGVNLFLFWEINDFRIDTFYIYAFSTSEVDKSQNPDFYEKEVLEILGVTVNYFILDTSILSIYLGTGFAGGQLKTTNNNSVVGSIYNEDNYGYYIPVKAGIEAFRSHHFRFYFDVAGYLPLVKQKAIVKPGENYEDIEERYLTPIVVSLNLSIGLGLDEFGEIGDFEFEEFF